jgi:hypothetical protein
MDYDTKCALDELHAAMDHFHSEAAADDIAPVTMQELLDAARAYKLRISAAFSQERRFRVR